MKFDIVIGNPPYNNDIYLDFITTGKYIGNKVCMITPAKWQGKLGIKNEAFRKLIVPYMKEIVYYPDCGELFDIGEVGGISYFLIDKEKHPTKKIINRCKTNDYINWSEAYRDIEQTISCYADSIIKKIEFKGERKFKLDNYNNFNYMITTPPAIGGTKGAGYFLFGETGMCQCIKLGKTYSMKAAAELPNHYKVLCSASNLEELQYKWSYINTKLIRLLVLMGICKQSILAEETWRMVPMPERFDHIFTDKELYEKYSLTDKEIQIIESIIKNRD